MKKYIIGNFKMNMAIANERRKYIEKIKTEVLRSGFTKSEIVLCPPFIYFDEFVRELNKTDVKIGAQNIFWEARGAYTGEISAEMVKNVGANYVIVGHSERRTYLGENDEIVNMKVKLAIKSGLKVILCVGETMDKRQSGKIQDILESQLLADLEGVSMYDLKNIFIAYEPIWAIGTGIIPTDNDILEAKLLIRKILARKYDSQVVKQVNLIYGGSVNSGNFEMVCLSPTMDGVLVGGSSLEPDEMIKMAQIVENN